MCFSSLAQSPLCDAVASPFDVKNGRGQIPGVSQVGHSHNGSTGSLSDSDTYNIKFTFAASPHAKTEGSPVRESLPSCHQGAVYLMDGLSMHHKAQIRPAAGLSFGAHVGRISDICFLPCGVITCQLMGTKSALEACCKLCTQ